MAVTGYWLTQGRDDCLRCQLFTDATGRLDEGCANVDRDPCHVLTLGCDSEGAKRVSEGHDEAAMHGLSFLIVSVNHAAGLQWAHEGHNGEKKA